MVHGLQTLKRMNNEAAGVFDLQRFCSDNSSKYDLSKPFVVNGWKYATNGWLAVRVKTTDPECKDSHNLPNVAKAFDPFRLTIPVAFPAEVKLVSGGCCPVCSYFGGGGHVPTKVYAECDCCLQVVQQKAICPTCGNMSPDEARFACEIKGVCFSVREWRMIQRLPGVLLCSRIEDGKPAVFSFGDRELIGEAALMPLAKQEPKRVR